MIDGLNLRYRLNLISIQYQLITSFKRTLNETQSLGLLDKKAANQDCISSIIKTLPTYLHLSKTKTTTDHHQKLPSIHPPNTRSIDPCRGSVA